MCFSFSSSVAMNTYKYTYAVYMCVRWRIKSEPVPHFKTRSLQWGPPMTNSSPSIHLYPLPSGVLALTTIDTHQADIHH